jgi:hypothetical protein
MWNGEVRMKRCGDRLVTAVRDFRAPAVHVVDFPGLRVNHALLFYAVEKDAEGWRFSAYDPNSPGEPVEVRFDRSHRRFHMAPTPYFVGGWISAYEVYCRGMR